MERGWLIVVCGLFVGIGHDFWLLAFRVAWVDDLPGWRGYSPEGVDAVLGRIVSDGPNFVKPWFLDKKDVSICGAI